MVVPSLVVAMETLFPGRKIQVLGIEQDSSLEKKMLNLSVRWRHLKVTFVLSDFLFYDTLILMLIASIKFSV